jgi:hypothetical protein
MLPPETPPRPGFSRRTPGKRLLAELGGLGVGVERKATVFPGQHVLGVRGLQQPAAGETAQRARRRIWVAMAASASALRGWAGRNWT